MSGAARALCVVVVASSGLLACDRPAAPIAQAATGTTAAPSSSLRVQSMSATPLAPSSARVSDAPGIKGTIVTFDGDEAGTQDPAFNAVVGTWYVAEDAGAKGLKVDGSKGHPSDATYPLAVWSGDVPSGDVRISVRFYPEGGVMDQGAGIAFAIAPDSSYLGVRANALEGNLLYFKVVKGVRTVFDDVPNVPTQSKAWHTLALEIREKRVKAEVDGKKVFEKVLDAAPSGRVGLWSKADSQILFDDFKVEPVTRP